MDIKVYDEIKTTNRLSPLSAIVKTPYPCVGVFGPHKSGKSTLLRNLVEKLVGPNTCLHVFSTTCNVDPMQIAMIRDATVRGNSAVKYTSMYRDDGSNRLEDLIAYAEERSTDYELTKISQFKDEIGAKTYPDHIIYLDDIGGQSRNQLILQLLRVSRHGRFAILIAGHSPITLLPDAFQEFNLVCCYGNMRAINVTRVIEGAGLPIDRKDALQQYAILPKYTCLTFDRDRGKCYRNLQPGSSDNPIDVERRYQEDKANRAYRTKHDSEGDESSYSDEEPDGNVGAGSSIVTKIAKMKSPSGVYVRVGRKRIPWEVIHPDMPAPNRK